MTHIRDVIITAQGIEFIVSVKFDDDLRGAKKQRRWNIRMAGNKQAIDEVLDAGVISVIDHAIKTGTFEAVCEELPV
jgi:hypothetical protein